MVRNLSESVHRRPHRCDPLSSHPRWAPPFLLHSGFSLATNLAQRCLDSNPFGRIRIIHSRYHRTNRVRALQRTTSMDRGFVRDNNTSTLLDFSRGAQLRTSYSNGHAGMAILDPWAKEEQVVRLASIFCFDGPVLVLVTMDST